ncbi:hypothetical protein FHS42_002261 [Streptomyces zagrosensis]|uniref:Uncharacterized protein n=2 Tax=Streptomyces zagrosensis TaxID=1042984 RepID=A0A7W9Q805_9ACTN|nr:hypothetical protein [Streptomyces zagrosensis]
MAGGGFIKLPGGDVVVAVSLPSPFGHPAATATGGTLGHGFGTAGGGGSSGSLGVRGKPGAADTESAFIRTGALSGTAAMGPRVRILVHAANRQRALTRLRNLGLRAVYLRGNAEPPTPDEITAVLHHPDGLVWRAAPDDDTESWHPIRALLRSTLRSRAVSG